MVKHILCYVVDAQRFTRLKSTEQEPVQENCEPTKVAETGNALSF